jgi:Ca2+-transporting ATPase
MIFHSFDIKESLEKLKTSEKGLSSKDAEHRIERYGYNEIETEEGAKAFTILLKQFTDPLVYILIAAIGISVFVGETLDAIAIGAIVILNAVLGFIQEFRAEKAIALLKKLSAPDAVVIRDGKEQVIPAKLLVPGDIIVLREGEKVPADARVIESFSLHTNESMLTGESVPVSKISGKLKEETVLNERKNMLYSSTVVTMGHGKAVVTGTGEKTELGKITTMVSQIERSETPLQKRLKRFGKHLGLIVLAVILIVFIIGVLRKFEFVELLMTSISLAVAAIPEGLPAIVTISLAIGIQRMLRKKSLIRSLKSIETLGSVTVICSDKTGTITKNEMTVTDIWVDCKDINVTGSGFSTKGEFHFEGKKINPKKYDPLFKISASCNNATLDYGDPTEIALLVMSKKAGVEAEERIDEVPFDSNKKYMMTIHKKRTYIKGAPEQVLKMCGYFWSADSIKKLTPRMAEEIHHKNGEMAKRSLRVLAAAYKEGNKCIFVGLTGMIDPPKDNVKEAVDLCRKAGIKIVMITGDNSLTAKAIAEQVGIMGGVIDGAAIEKMNHRELVKTLETVSIFSRVSPEHKVRILETLQEKGEIVAMTGDGLNDAPALKKSDVGVSMAKKGTDVAKEASDMVLLDDNFASIVSAVQEGRRIYDNIKKSTMYLLSGNVGEILLILFAMILFLPLPLLPLHLLWINLVTDGLPALALAGDMPERDIMSRKPRSSKEHILSGSFLFIFGAGLLVGILTLGLFYFAHNIQGDHIDEARTMALTTLVIFEMYFVFTVRSSKFNFWELKINKWLIAVVIISLLLQVGIIYSPLNKVFKLSPLPLYDWILILVASSPGLLLFEIMKLAKKKRVKRLAGN